MRLIYLPLEPYEERYTLQLRDWTHRAFQKYPEIEIVEILGEPMRGKDTSIKHGVVLDAHGRSYWALTQTASLMRYLSENPLTDNDVIYNQDMFHPGWEAVNYLYAQMPEVQRPRLYTYCHAQSIDPNDFTFPMRHWMRHYELMVDRTIDGIFMSSHAMVDMMRASLFDAPLHPVGLPFSREEVRERAGLPNGGLELEQRPMRVLFSSRWDAEKQPDFYMDVVEELFGKTINGTPIEFVVCTSSKHLRSNDQKYVDRALRLQNEGKLSVKEGLKKYEYYNLLAQSRLQFNCSLQDFISITLLEASTLGTPTLAPSYLTFPEALSNRANQLYVAWSVEDACTKVIDLLENPPPLSQIEAPSLYHDGSLSHMIEIMCSHVL